MCDCIQDEFVPNGAFALLHIILYIYTDRWGVHYRLDDVDVLRVSLKSLAPNMAKILEVLVRIIYFNRFVSCCSFSRSYCSCQLLGHRDSIVAYTGDADNIGSPCVDALVENGTIVEATVFNDSCGYVADNELLVDLEVDVRKSWCILCTGEVLSGVCSCNVIRANNPNLPTFWSCMKLKCRRKGGRGSPCHQSNAQQPRASLFRRPLEVWSPTA